MVRSRKRTVVSSLGVLVLVWSPLNASRSFSCFGKAVAANSEPVVAQVSIAFFDTSCTTVSIEALTPSLRRLVTAKSSIPQGMMWSNHDRSVVTFKAKPCIVRPRLSRTPTAAIFRGLSFAGCTQTPGYLSRRPQLLRPISLSASMRTCSNWWIYVFVSAIPPPRRPGRDSMGYPVSCPGPW